MAKRLKDPSKLIAEMLTSGEIKPASELPETISGMTTKEHDGVHLHKSKFEHIHHQYNKDEQIIRQAVLKAAVSLTATLPMGIDEKVQKTKEVAEELVVWVKQSPQKSGK